MTISTLIKNQFTFFIKIPKNNNLLWALVKKDFKSRYASSLLGFLWAIFQPLAMLITYTIVFSLIFRVAIPETTYKSVPFAVFLMLGFVPYNIFSETLSRSSNILIENMSMITKMVFPYELFPISIFITTFITGLITLILTLLLMVILGIIPTFVNFPFLLLFLVPLILFTIGLSWIVSCVTVVFRDLAYAIPIVLNLLFFSVPVIYSYEMIEKSGVNYPILSFIVKLNPLYSIIIGFKYTFIGKTLALNSNLIISSYLTSVIIFLLGGIIFLIFKRDLADRF